MLIEIQRLPEGETVAVEMSSCYLALDAGSGVCSWSLEIRLNDIQGSTRNATVRERA